MEREVVVREARELITLMTSNPNSMANLHSLKSVSRNSPNWKINLNQAPKRAPNSTFTAFPWDAQGLHPIWKRVLYEVNSSTITAAIRIEYLRSIRPSCLIICSVDLLGQKISEKKQNTKMQEM